MIFGDPLMNKRYFIIPAVIGLLLSLQLFLKPYFQKRDALNVVTTVLTHWKNTDLTLAMPYWEKQADMPPVYNLIDYKIKNIKLEKKKDAYHAQITAALEFPPGNISSSKKEWRFVLNKTRYGWKIFDAYHVEISSP
jgi:hypothetical protein